MTTAWSRLCTCERTESVSPAIAACGAGLPPFNRQSPRYRNAATSPVSGKCVSSCAAVDSTTRNRLTKGLNAAEGAWTSICACRRLSRSTCRLQLPDAISRSNVKLRDKYNRINYFTNLQWMFKPRAGARALRERLYAMPATADGADGLLFQKRHSASLHWPAARIGVQRTFALPHADSNGYCRKTVYRLFAIIPLNASDYRTATIGY